MFRIIYNILMPVGFLFFLPSLILKYKKRGGWKSTYAERFAIYSDERIEELKNFQNAIWIHAVSVGETVVAMSLINGLLKKYPECKIVISTTTTTGQELARKVAPERVAVIFCPIDFPWMVKKVFKILNPSMLVIFETEIWPNLIAVAQKYNIPKLLVNGRMSDKSSKGYRKTKMFFEPLLEQFDAILVQTKMDMERFNYIAPNAKVEVSGNIKYDQKVPENLPEINYDDFFGKGENIVLLGASTHPGEEEVLAVCYKKLRDKYPNLKLVLVPRHAERGGDVSLILEKLNLSYCQKSKNNLKEQTVDVLLADTTGEMLSLMKNANLVVMGKSLAGHDEGHNLIEPALFGKPIITGSKLRNFRQILQELCNANAIVTVDSDEDLYVKIDNLLKNPTYCKEIGERAKSSILNNSGAINKTIDKISNLLKLTNYIEEK